MLKTRVLTASILAISVGLLLFFANTLAWQLFVLLATGIAAFEWAGFVPTLSKLSKILFGVLVTALVWVSFGYLDANDLSIVYYLTLFSAVWMLFAVARFQKTQGKALIKSPALILLLGVASIVLFSYVLFALRETFGAALFLLSMFVVWAIDTGAYFSGRRFGRRKLAIYVSPGKTWEGVLGGFLLSYVIAWAGLQWLEPSVKISYELLALGLAMIGLYSVVGDLYESLLKRQAGIKDSGTIFPGHGGMLDRIDSLVIAMPMFYILWLLVSNTVQL